MRGPDVSGPRSIETSEAGSVPALVRVAAQEWDIDQVVKPLMDADIEAAFPGRGEEIAFRELLRGSVVENLSMLRRHLAGEVHLGDVDLVRPVEFARTQAELGIPQGSLQRSYRVGLQVLWHDWAACLGEVSEQGGFAAEEAFEALSWSTRRILSWFDFVVLTVDRGYAQREESMRQTGAKMRVAVVRELLEGNQPATAEDLFYTLRYDINGHHLVVQVADVSDSAAQNLANKMSLAAQAGQTLLTRLSVSEVIVWLGRRKSWESPQVDAVLDVLSMAGVRASVSETAPGLEGFRSGHGDVRRVEAVRSYWTEAPATLSYAEVRLEAMLLANTAEARRFVLQELGPLAEDTSAVARLRETLLASFTAGSHIGTAQMLQLHEHTVRNRLHKIEQLVGHQLTERRIELQVALRLHRLVGSTPSAEDSG